MCLYLTALAIFPGDPTSAISTVVYFKHLSKFVAMSSCMSTLSAYQGYEMKDPQINLQKFCQFFWIYR